MDPKECKSCLPSVCLRHQGAPCLVTATAVCLLDNSTNSIGLCGAHLTAIHSRNVCVNCLYM